MDDKSAMKEMLSTLVKNGNISISDIVSVLYASKEEKQLTDELVIPKVGYRENRNEYYITVPRKYSKTGKRYPVYGKTEKEATENYKVEVALFLNGVNLVNIESGDGVPTLKTMIIFTMKRYIYYDICESSYARYESACDAHIFKESIVNKSIDTISSSELNEFFRCDNIATLCSSTLSAITVIMKKTFLHSKELEYRNDNPMEFVSVSRKKVKQPRKQKQYVKGTEIERITRLVNIYCELSVTSPRYRIAPIFMVMLYTGLRIGEALALKETCIDREKRIITIKKQMAYVQKRDENLNRLSGSVIEKEPKTSSSDREILLVPQAEYWIDRMIDMNRKFNKYNSEYIFVNKFGRVPSKGSVNTFWKQTLSALNIPQCTPHKLRKTFITVLINNGIKIADVSKMVGHKSKITTINSYLVSEYDDNDSSELVDNMEKAFLLNDNNMTTPQNILEIVG